MIIFCQTEEVKWYLPPTPRSGGVGGYVAMYQRIIGNHRHLSQKGETKYKQLLRICLDFTANKFYVILFSLFEALFTIFTLFVLANRPLFAATKQCKSAQKHLSTKLEIKSKQILSFSKKVGLIFDFKNWILVTFLSFFLHVFWPTLYTIKMSFWTSWESP